MPRSLNSTVLGWDTASFFKRLQQIQKSSMPRSLSSTKVTMITFGNPFFILFLDKVSDFDAFISFGMSLQVFDCKLSINSLLNSIVWIFESKYSRVDQVKFVEDNL